MQAKECQIIGDSKHDYLFHKRRNFYLSNKDLEYKEKNLTYKQVEKLIKDKVENLIKITLRRSLIRINLNHILQVS